MTEVAIQEKNLKEKFSTVRQWLADIVHPIKKDLRQDHLIQDRGFAHKYFRGKTINKITTEEFAEAYSKAIEEEEKGEEIADFIFHRWLMKNTDIYYFFDRELSKIAEDYTTLKSIDHKVGQEIKNKAVSEFGPEKAYLFSFLNGVVFDQKIFDELAHEAEQTRKKTKQQAEGLKEQQDLDARLRNHEAEMARLKNRYEDRIAGLEKKYERDVSALKKQLAQLQRHLQAKS